VRPGFYWIRLGVTYTGKEGEVLWVVGEWDGRWWNLPGYDSPGEESPDGVAEIGDRVERRLP
jgi:hypothetical protein